jgi:hypothetical protein
MIPWINYPEWYEHHIDEYVPIEETEALYGKVLSIGLKF